MRACLKTIALSLALSIGGVSRAFAQSDAATARQEIQAVYDRENPWMKAAAGTRNASMVKSYWEKIFTPDFVAVHPDGTTMNRDQWIAFYVTGLRTVKRIHRYEIKIQKIAMRGKKRADVVQHFDISFDSANSNNGSTHTTTWIGSEKDTWVKTRSGWQEQHKITLEIRTLTDGKPNNPALEKGQSGEGQSPGAEHELRQIEQEITDALVKGDVTAFERYYTDSCTLISYNGSVSDKAGLIADLKSRDLKYEASQLDQMKVQVYGNMAVITFRSTDKGSYKGQDISGHHQCTDVFVKQGDHWQIVAEQLTTIPK